MKPLNRAERNNTFLAFLFLFLITIGIVITVVFFSLKVQFDENDRLRKRMLKMQNQMNLSDSFRVAMNVAMNELTRYDIETKEPPYVTKGKVEKKIDNMRSLIRNMPDSKSDEERSIYELVIHNIADLNDAKEKIKTLELDKN